MAKPMKQRRSRAEASRRPVARHGGPDWVLLALAAAGMLLSAYLTYSAWQGKLVAGCAPGDPCDVVLSSRWSTLLGMPTSFWGFLTYALLGFIALNKPSIAQWKFAWSVSLFGLAYSLYLSAVSYFVLDALCPYCLTSLALMTAIFGLVIYRRPAEMARGSTVPWVAKTAAASILLIAAFHLHYLGYWGETAAPEDPWIRGLAEHLTKIDAKFYGASWCPHCQDQKESFGASAPRLPYIECSPAGPKGPTARACTEAGIKSYPTWVIDGQRYVGTQTLENLAQHSRYKGVNP